MSTLLKVITLSALGQTAYAAGTPAEVGEGECLLRTGRGLATPFTGNIKSDDKVPYSSRKVSLIIIKMLEETRNQENNTDREVYMGRNVVNLILSSQNSLR